MCASFAVDTEHAELKHVLHRITFLGVHIQANGTVDECSNRWTGGQPDNGWTERHTKICMACGIMQLNRLHYCLEGTVITVRMSMTTLLYSAMQDVHAC